MALFKGIDPHLDGHCVWSCHRIRPSQLNMFGNIAKETGLIIALVLAILLVWYTNRLSLATRRKILINRKWESWYTWSPQF